MYDIVGIGATLVDVLILVEQFPDEDTKLKAAKFHKQGGGPCATGLVAASRLGAKTAYFGTVGDDFYGTYMIDDFRKHRVGTEFIEMVENSDSAQAVVLLNESSSSRTVIWHQGTVPMPSADHIDLDTLKQSRYLYLDGHHTETAIYAAQQARRYGVKVFLDIGGIYPGIEKLLPLVDVLIPSEEFAKEFTKAINAEDALVMLQERYEPEILVITQGDKGGILFQRGTAVRYPAFPVAAVDTNGAGDVFHGAFAAALIRGYNPMQCAVFASAASALKCRSIGARESIPDFEQTRSFLHKRKAELDMLGEG